MRAGEAPSRAPDAAPTVSVIIPAYNAGWSIERTLASLQAQTLADFEALVVDDGSTDDTGARVQAAVGDDPRFRLIRQANAGVSAARNRGLAEARSAYVANLDSDDVWRPEFLAELVAAMDAAGPGASMAFARSLWIDRDDAAISPPPDPLTRPVTYRELLLYNPIGNGSSTLMRRDAIVASGGWDVGLVRLEDWLLQLQLAARGEVVVVDKPLVHYRITENSASAALGRCARTTLEVVRRLQGREPRLPRVDYWRARSLAMLWLLRKAKRVKRRDLYLFLTFNAYLRNPVWFLDRELREPLVSAVRKTARRLLPSRQSAAAKPARADTSTEAGTVAVAPES
jgi:glycosyltransferase involved in cell wall biosynthesis